MMGTTHASSGVVAYLAVLPVLPGVHPPATVALGVIAAAGAAMLPDLDHPKATVANCYGPPTRILASGIETISEGHRNGTHSLLGIGAFTAATVGLQQVGGWWLVGWLVLLLGVGVTALGLAPTKQPFAYLGLVAVGVLFLTGSTGWANMPTDTVPHAVAIGCAAHIVGDMLTPEGCPLLWLPSWLPLPSGLRKVTRYRFGVGLVKTERKVEAYVVAPALALVGLWLGLGLIGLQPSVPSLVNWLPRVTS